MVSINQENEKLVHESDNSPSTLLEQRRNSVGGETLASGPSDLPANAAMALPKQMASFDTGLTSAIFGVLDLKK